MKKKDIIEKLKEFKDDDELGVFIAADNIPCYSIMEIHEYDLYVYRGFEFKLMEYKGEILHCKGR